MDLRITSMTVMNPPNNHILAYFTCVTPELELKACMLSFYRGRLTIWPPRSVKFFGRTFPDAALPVALEAFRVLGGVVPETPAEEATDDHGDSEYAARDTDAAGLRRFVGATEQTGASANA